MDNIFDSGYSLEEAFFKKKDAELIAQHRKLEQMKRTREAIREVSGITNEKVLDRLIALNISTALLSSIAVIPLVEVAWADGKIDESERKAVLAGADHNGVKAGSVDYQLLEHWLRERPEPKLLDAWTHYIEGLCENLSETERESLKNDLIGRARKVAEATGGIMGLMTVSPEESKVLKTMEKAFGRRS